MTTLVLSEPMELDLEVYRGDSGQFRISITDGAEPTPNPIDVSDAEWRGQIRHKVADETIITEFDFVPVFDDASSVDVFLTSENAELINASGHYDIEMTRGSAVSTILAGSILLTKDVSR